MRRWAHTQSIILICQFNGIVASTNEQSISVSESGSSALPTANRQQCDGVEKRAQAQYSQRFLSDVSRCDDILLVAEDHEQLASLRQLLCAEIVAVLDRWLVETGDPQEERLCWVLTLRSAIQVRQDTEVESGEMLSMRRQASGQ